MNADKRPIRLIFDTSAVVAYTRGSIHTGELLTEIDNEGGVVGLPTLCLTEAHWMVSDRDRLRLLIDHHATAIVEPSADWAALGALQDAIGALDATAAMLSAIDEEGFVLTSRPILYGSIDGGGLTIPIPL